MSLSVVKLEAAHASGCAHIEKTCFSAPWSEADIESLVANPDARYFVAVDGTRAVGYGGLYATLDEGNINNIAVLPEYRRQKIASSILSALIEESKRRGLTSLFLEVRESNTGAIALYEQYGFETVGRRKGFYSHPAEDALTMKKSM